MQRVLSNIAVTPTRRLTKQFDNAGAFGGTTKAIGKTVPTKVTHAMGQAGKSGIVTFVASDGGTQVFTLYEWNKTVADINSGNGWVLNGNNAAASQQSCDAMALISFQIAEDALFFIVAGTNAVTECLVSGTSPGVNPNSDLSATTNTTH